MHLSEQVQKLQQVVHKLPSGDQAFAKGLITSYQKYQSLTPKQEPWIGKLLAKAHPLANIVPPVQIPEEVSVGDFSGVVKLFESAKAHLKAPKITLKLGETVVKLALAGPKSKYPGSVVVKSDGKYPYATFYGRVTPEGQWKGSLAYETLPGLVELLTEFGKNPAQVAKTHGKLTGNCCFCNKTIGDGEDKRSLMVGFGPVCAKHYGLLDEWYAGVAKAEQSVAEQEVIKFADLMASEPKTAQVSLVVEDATPLHAAMKTLKFQQHLEQLEEATTEMGIKAKTATALAKQLEIQINLDKTMYPKDDGPAIASVAKIIQNMADAEMAKALEKQTQAIEDGKKLEALEQELIKGLEHEHPLGLYGLNDGKLLCYLCEQPADEMVKQDGFWICPACHQELEQA
jgi:hypothetical protein